MRVTGTVFLKVLLGEHLSKNRVCVEKNGLRYLSEVIYV